MEGVVGEEKCQKVEDRDEGAWTPATAPSSLDGASRGEGRAPLAQRCVRGAWLGAPGLRTSGCREEGEWVEERDL